MSNPSYAFCKPLSKQMIFVDSFQYALSNPIQTALERKQSLIQKFNTLEEWERVLYEEQYELWMACVKFEKQSPPFAYFWSVSENERQILELHGFQRAVIEVEEIPPPTSSVPNLQVFILGIFNYLTI